MRQGAKFIGFGNQKGGVGKSTLSEIIASILYYECKQRILVMDCDEGQHSFANLREKERMYLRENDTAWSHKVLDLMEKNGCGAYSVHTSSIASAIQTAEKLCSEECFDLVLFDMPGRCNEADILLFSASLDYLITPVEMDDQSLVSSMEYAMSVKHVVKSLNTPLNGIYILWNKVNRNSRQELRLEYSDLFRSRGLEVFDSCVYQAYRFSRGFIESKDVNEIFRSTYLPPQDRNKTGIDDVVRELFNKIIDDRNE